MAKSKMGKAMKEVKKGVAEIVDDAKENTNKAVDYIKDKTK
jgi:F0F1-type ATP synthase membrane subunit b/b'